MTFEYVLPGMRIKKRSAKDLVISILASRWPLSIRKIYNIIRKKYNFSISYQAVHKAVNELIRDGIILRKGKEYQLKDGWIRELKEFISKLEKSYLENHPILENKIPSDITFDKACELYEFFLDAFNKDIFDATKKSICFHGMDVWNCLLATDEMIHKMKNLASKYTFLMAVECDNPVNRLLKTFWDKIGVKVKIGVKTDATIFADLMVVGNFVIQIFYPEKLVKKIIEVNNKIKSLEDWDFSRYHDLYFSSYGKINMIITQNENLAQEIRTRTERMFGIK
jgi:hypothetical protein